jgi:integrase
LTWRDYKIATDTLIAELGKHRIVADLDPEDFATLRKRMAKQWGPHRLNKTIQSIRTAFKHAYETRLLKQPMRFGPSFNRASAKTIRLHRANRGPKLFTLEEIARMLGCPPWRPAARGQLLAMILLGVNCGFGNSDCANFGLSAIDLDGGWIDYPRPKTGVARRCWLWPETVAAIREVLDDRPDPLDDKAAGTVFVTKYGNSWGKDASAITKEFRKLLSSLDINGHRNFYSLRHTFRTIADEAKDQPAADYIMGHESSHMSNHYRERISDERLKAVAEYVRSWLFGAARQSLHSQFASAKLSKSNEAQVKAIFDKMLARVIGGTVHSAVRPSR